MLENVKLALQGVRAHKLRSILTMLGIIIGIASLITIVSTIKGTNEQIKQNLVGSGTNSVTVRLYQDDYYYDLAYGNLPNGVAPIDPAIVSELNDLRGVEDCSIFLSRDYVEGVYCGSTSFSGSLRGVDERYFSVCGYNLCYGRGMLASDFDTASKVVILDTRAVSSLFSGANPIGKTIEISGDPFTIIGVVEKANKAELTINSINDYYMYADTTSGSIFVPISTWPIIYRFDEPQSVAVRATSTDMMTTAGKNVADLLTERQIGSTDSAFSYRSEDLLEQAQQLQDLSSSTNKQMLWIASISLLVGGIGVMNIMLVSVTERTAEIGLKKAIGAKKRRILWQFLTEAAVLTSTGGILGVIAGIIMAILISQINGTPSAISVPSIIIAVIFSTVIGVAFGILPATKAANLNPIEALRRD